MSNNEKFDAPDADIILRALGPPKRDFRVHKLVLSLASPVFKDMFSLPQPTSDDPRKSSAAEIEIIEVTDPPNALSVILQMIYPLPQPSLCGNIDTLVECLTIADKYDIRGPESQLCTILTRISSAHPLRVYAIAARFGFAKLAESTSRRIISSVNLAEIAELPEDFEFIPATAYHKLVRHRTNYLEAAAEIVKRTPLETWCYSCPGGVNATKEVVGLRLAHLILTGTPLEAGACFEAWVKAYGRSAECREDCVLKFIRSGISRANKGLVKPGEPTPQKKTAQKVKVKFLVALRRLRVA